MDCAQTSHSAGRERGRVSVGEIVGGGRGGRMQYLGHEDLDLCCILRLRFVTLFKVGLSRNWNQIYGNLYFYARLKEASNRNVQITEEIRLH